MFSVVYVSSEATRLTDRDLEDLLIQCRRENATRGITGLLLFKDGNFMQLLEGEQNAVLVTLARIKNDVRHRNITVLMEEETSGREFANWSMAYRKLNSDTPVDVPGYSDFLEVPLTSERFRNDPSRALRLLLVFKK
jgi:hypothetical protein